ncbi:MAG: Crp/Fnr family transcriptional regulator [Synechocystis sp.]|jgi:CRP-like cAMP-binding protein
MLTSYRTTENLLLASVPPSNYPTLFENLELISWDFQQVIYQPKQTIEYVYFPIKSVVTLGAVAADQSVIEIGLIGKESFVGLSLFLGMNQATHQTTVLVPEAACRLAKDVFLTEAMRPGAFREILLRQTQARLNHFAQNVACKTHHTIDKQLARWLMSVYDRIEGNELFVTQPVIAKLLGVRRATITDSAIKLQNAGFIYYRRGKIIIIDPVGLEAFACECYQVVKSLYDFPRASEALPLTPTP